MHLVKRAGHYEPFDQRKVYASVYSACLANHYHKKEAELVAQAVTRDIVKWMKGKSNVSSDRIFIVVSDLLQRYDAKVAFLYSTHRDIS